MSCVVALAFLFGCLFSDRGLASSMLQPGAGSIFSRVEVTFGGHAVLSFVHCLCKLRPSRIEKCSACMFTSSHVAETFSKNAF